MQRNYLVVIKRDAMTSLVLDDNELVRNILAKHITTAGYCVITCRDADTALQVFQDNPRITVMFVDLYLDRYYQKIKDGLEFIRLVRSYEKDSMLEPCYIAAFSSDDQLADTAIQAGADVFLKKPVTSQTVQDILSPQSGAPTGMRRNY